MQVEVESNGKSSFSDATVVKIVIGKLKLRINQHGDEIRIANEDTMLVKPMAANVIYLLPATKEQR